MEGAARRLGTWQAGTFRREGLRLERLAARLEPSNVAKLLARGFALVLKDGHVVARSAALGAGDEVRVALAAGWFDALVLSRDAGPDPLPGRAGPPERSEGPTSGGSPVDPPPRRR